MTEHDTIDIKNMSLYELRKYLLDLSNKLYYAKNCYILRQFVFDNCYDDQDIGHKTAIKIAKKKYNILKGEHEKVKGAINKLKKAQTPIIDVQQSVSGSFGYKSKQNNKSVPANKQGPKSKPKKRSKSVSVETIDESIDDLDLDSLINEHNELLLKQEEERINQYALLEKERKNQYDILYTKLTDLNVDFEDIDIYNLYINNKQNDTVCDCGECSLAEHYERYINYFNILYDNKAGPAAKDAIFISVDPSIRDSCYVSLLVDKNMTASTLMDKFIKMFKYGNPGPDTEYRLLNLRKDEYIQPLQTIGKAVLPNGKIRVEPHMFGFDNDTLINIKDSIKADLLEIGEPYDKDVVFMYAVNKTLFPAYNYLNLNKKEYYNFYNTLFKSLYNDNFDKELLDNNLVQILFDPNIAGPYGHNLLHVLKNEKVGTFIDKIANAFGYENEIGTEYSLESDKNGKKMNKSLTMNRITRDGESFTMTATMRNKK
jgi:hypothetical protein